MKVYHYHPVMVLCLLCALFCTYGHTHAAETDLWPVRKSTETGSLWHESSGMPRKAHHVRSSLSGDAAPIEFIGCVLWSSQDHEIGIYSFDTEDTRMHPVVVGDDYYGNRGALFADGKYFCVSEFDMDIKVFSYAGLYDATTWRKIKEIESPAKNLYSYCLAQDPTTKIVYGCFRNEDGSGFELGTIDIDKIERTGVIAPVTGDKYVSISFSSTGQLYGIGFNEGTLYKIDKHTGEAEIVGETEISQMYLTSGEIDPRTDKYYFAAQTFLDKAIYEIDLETAEAIEVMEEIPGGCQIMGLHLLTPPAADKAPAQVADLEVDFPEVSLIGRVSFTTPSTYFDGTPASGALTYSIMANGETMASGTTSYGQKETVEVVLPEPGDYLIQVRVANEAGQSPVAEIDKWVGQDSPCCPESVSVTRDGVINKLSWTPVCEWAHGGNIDSAITYDVVRYPDGVVVVSGTPETSIEDRCIFEEMVPVRYGVVAVSEGMKSFETLSDYVVAGSVTPPYKECFESAETFAGFVTLDLDKDGNTWSYDTDRQAAASKANKKKNSNDWLFTPPMTLNAGHKYTASFTLGSENPFDPAKIEVKLGCGTDAESMDLTLLEATEFPFMENTTYVKEFIIEESGTYFLGFHSVSKANMSSAIVYDIEVTEGIGLHAPAKGTLNIIPDPDGNPSVGLEITVPSISVNNEPIASVDKMECWMDGVLLDTRSELGAVTSYTVNAVAPEAGYHVFRILAGNSFGMGEPLEAKVFLGVNKPATPENLKVTEYGESGKVKVTWDKVTKDIDGFSLVPDFVQYSVLVNGEVIAENLKDCEYEHQAIGAGDQAFVKYEVAAYTPAGSNGKNADSPYVFIGQSYSVPFLESFKAGRPSYYFLTEGSGQWQTSGSLGLYNDGCIVYVPNYVGSESSLISGKISLEGAVAPKLAFAALHSPDNNDEVEVRVLDTESGKLTTVKSMTLNEGNSWVMTDIDLSELSGHKIMLYFHILCNQTQSYSMFDEIAITADNSGTFEITGARDLVIEVVGKHLNAKADGIITVFEPGGRRVAQSNGDLSITLPSGVYVVKSGSDVKKVAVR